MALENLVRLAERISSLPDEALAQIAQTEGIEPVIAASELKNRQDVRAEAAAQPQQNPSVVEQLIQRAMGQQQQPQGMPQQGMQQQGMPQQMPPQMPPQGPPQMPPQMPQQMPPMASMGGLLRRFSNGGLTDEQLIAMGLDPATMTQADYMALGPEAFEESIREAQEPYYETGISGGATLGDWGRTIGAASAAKDLPRAEYREQYPDLASGAALSGRARRVGEREFTETYSPEYFAKNPQHLSLLRQAGGDIGAFEALVNRAQQLPPPPSKETDVPTVSDSITNVGIGRGQPPPKNGTKTKQDADTQDDVPAWLSGKRARDIRYFETKGAEGQDALYRMATTSFMQGQSARNNALRGMRLSADPTSTELTRKLSKLDSDDAERMQEYSDDIDKFMGDLDELEKDIPDRKSIKDRFKKQIDYGLAQAFFSAAEKGSPDFMTAMAGAMAGASEVMNKMTGQEQKELYKHATDAFTRKASRANAAFKQRTELGKQIASRAATTAKSRTNLLEALKFQAKVSDDAIDNARENYNAVITAGKTQSEIQEAKRNYFRDYEDQIADNVATMAKDAAGQLTDTKQWEAHYSVDGAIVGVPSAQRTVNLGLKSLFRELTEKTEAARKADAANPAQNAMNELMTEIEESDERRIGDRTLMEAFGPDFQAILQTTNARDAAEIAQQLRRVYTWIDL